jgi:CIC family chloride channel protein
MLAGVAGGIGAVLQTPIGGALFAVEILYASIALEFSAFIPCVIASTVGFFTFRIFYGDIWLIHLPKSVGVHHFTDLLFFAVFLPLIAFGGLFFSHLLNEFRNRFFRRSPLPDFLKPALGGGLVGCVALLCPQILGGGYDYLPKLLEGDLPFLLMLWLILPKMLATVLTVSSGGSGGLLVPSLFIGGCLGGVLGYTVQSTIQVLALPIHAPDLSTCILIGMSAFYAGIGKLPFAAAVIVCEVGGFDYAMLVPLLILNLLQLAIQSPRVSLYEEQVLTPLDSEAHFGNFSADLLKSMSVEGLMKENLLAHFPTIPESATIPQTVKLIAAESDTLFPVVDVQGILTGILTASDVWTAFRNRKKWALHTAKDLSQDFRTLQITVCLNDNLYTALRVCTLWQVSAIPIIDAEQCRLLGMLRRDTIIAAYNARLATARWE